MARIPEHEIEQLKVEVSVLQLAEKMGVALKQHGDEYLGYHLLFKCKTESAKIREHLQRVGILKKTGHEFFRGSLVIPVIDADGVITEVYGRKIRDDLRKGTPTHLYLPGPHRGVWNTEGLMASSEVISV
jgi:DNA primase